MLAQTEFALSLYPDYSEQLACIYHCFLDGTVLANQAPTMDTNLITESPSKKIESPASMARVSKLTTATKAFPNTSSTAPRNVTGTLAYAPPESHLVQTRITSSPHGSRLKLRGPEPAISELDQLSVSDFQSLYLTCLDEWTNPNTSLRGEKRTSDNTTQHLPVRSSLTSNRNSSQEYGVTEIGKMGKRSRRIKREPANSIMADLL
jgi:hypothetical protein